MADFENAIYIPSSSERDRNKSKNPRVLPSGDELRRLLTEYLLVRPDNSNRHLLLSKETHSKMHRNGIIDVWEEALLEKYLVETEERYAKKSHYGRHFFTTFWTTTHGLDRHSPQFLYMRGDEQSDEDGGRRAVDDYINPHYGDIESLYREHIFNLNF